MSGACTMHDVSGIDLRQWAHWAKFCIHVSDADRSINKNVSSVSLNKNMLINIGWMDGGRGEGWMDRCMDGWMEKVRMDGERKDGWKEEGWMDGQTDRQMYGQMDGQMGRWMDRRMDGWMDGQMEEGGRNTKIHGLVSV